MSWFVTNKLKVPMHKFKRVTIRGQRSDCVSKLTQYCWSELQRNVKCEKQKWLTHNMLDSLSKIKVKVRVKGQLKMYLQAFVDNFLFIYTLSTLNMHYIHRSATLCFIVPSAYRGLLQRQYVGNWHHSSL